MDSLRVQIFNFLLALIIGCFIGMFFDVYRVMRTLFKPKGSLIPIFDLLWWLFVTIFVFTTLLWGTWGEVRFYLFIGIVAGSTLYFKKLSQSFMQGFTALVRWICKVVKITVRIILIPVQFLGRIITGIFGLISICLFKLIKGGQIVLKLTKNIGLIVPRRIFRRIRKFFQRRKN